MVFTFSALGQKTPFWANLFNKIKIFSLSENLVPRLIWICGIWWWCSLSVFDWKYLRQIWSKKSKLSVWAEISHIRLIWICRISCVHFLWFWPENPFSVNLVKIVSLSWNLVPRLIWICRCQWWCSLFLFLNKYVSLANLVQKFKIVCSKWKLIQILIRICKVQWRCLFYQF